MAAVTAAAAGAADVAAAAGGAGAAAGGAETTFGGGAVTGQGAHVGVGALQFSLGRDEAVQGLFAAHLAGHEGQVVFFDLRFRSASPLIGPLSCNARVCVKPA